MEVTKKKTPIFGFKTVITFFLIGAVSVVVILNVIGSSDKGIPIIVCSDESVNHLIYDKDTNTFSCL